MLSRARLFRLPFQSSCRAILLPVVCACVLLSGLGRVPTAESAGGKALDEYFSGKVVALDGKTVTLRYDFRHKDQLLDFEDRIPHRIKTRKGQGLKWFDDKMQIIGNAGARHRAEWMGDVMVTATFIPDITKNFGGYLSPVSETEDFATFTFVETYFHAFDGQSGGMNSIIKFGDQWREGDSADAYIGFRYGPRKPARVKPSPGIAMRASFGLQKKKLIFRLPEYEMKGKDNGKPLKRFYVGFYAIKGRLLVDNIEITGQFSGDWLKRERVDLRTVKPIGDGVEEAVDEETAALISAYAGGKKKAGRELLAILKDESRGASVHQAALDALCAGPKRIVRNAIDLLYDPQVPARAFGIAIIRAHLGRDYGYKPKASEKSRAKAIRSLNTALKKKPGLLEG